MEINPNLYNPHERQIPFHQSNARFRLICTGVGFGKSAAGVNELLKQALQYPSLYAMIAPTIPMLKNSTLREFFKFCPHDLIKDYNRTERKITLINGSEIIGLSGDNERDIDRLRGMNLGGAYGDEIAICPEYMHNILIARLRDAKGPQKIWYTTTPKGFTWLYRIFVEKKNNAGELFKTPQDYEIFGGTSHDNPYTDQEYKRVLTETYAGSFSKQEIQGEFVGFEGLVYPEFSRNTHITSLPHAKLGVKRFIAGVDWGYTNPSVILCIGIDGDDRITVEEEFYEKRVDHEQLKEQALFLKKKYNIGNFYCDPSEPMFIQSFQRAGINAVEAENEVMPGIKAVAQMLQTAGDNRPRLMVNQRCLNTINEFQVYKYPNEKEGKQVDEQPIKVFDHAMDALRYAVMSLGRPKPVLSVAGARRR